MVSKRLFVMISNKVLTDEMAFVFPFLYIYVGFLKPLRLVCIYKNVSSIILFLR